MKILVVDDEKDIQPLFQQRFRKEIRKGDIDLEFACSGEEALMYLMAKEHEASLILSELGADDFITKPVDFSALKEKIKSIHHG